MRKPFDSNVRDDYVMGLRPHERKVYYTCERLVREGYFPTPTNPVSHDLPSFGPRIRAWALHLSDTVRSRGQREGVRRARTACGCARHPRCG